MAVGLISCLNMDLMNCLRQPWVAYLQVESRNRVARPPVNCMAIPEGTSRAYRIDQNTTGTAWVPRPTGWTTASSRGPKPVARERVPGGRGAHRRLCALL